MITEHPKSFKESIASGLVLVDFWAPWCGPCRRMEPVLEEVKNDLKSKGKNIKIIKINIEEQPELANEYLVLSIPTLLLFVDGAHIDTKVGGMDSAALCHWIEKSFV